MIFSYVGKMKNDTFDGRKYLLIYQTGLIRLPRAIKSQENKSQAEEYLILSKRIKALSEELK